MMAEDSSVTCKPHREIQSCQHGGEFAARDRGLATHPWLAGIAGLENEDYHFIECR